MPLTPNRNIIHGTEADRLSVSPDDEQLFRDTTADAFFVGNAESNLAGGHSMDVRKKFLITTSFTLTRTQEGQAITLNSSTTGKTLTIPTNANVPFPTGRTKIPIFNLSLIHISEPTRPY